MENVKKLLDAAKAATESGTDYKLAKSLGIPDQRISDYYKGRRVPDEFACLKIAEALEMPLAEVIALVKAEAEKDETRREAWRNYLKKLGGIAATVAALIFAPVIFNMSAGRAEAAQNQGLAGEQICIMSIWRWLLEIKAQLRRIGFPCGFSLNFSRVCQMAA